MVSSAALHAKASELSKLVVRMTTAAGSGHASSALSLAHLVAYLMYCKMRWDPADPWNPAADRLVLSEGHAVPIIYAAYADLGGAIGCRKDRPEGGPPDRSEAGPPGCECGGRLSVADLDGLRTRDSVLDGHPNPAEGFPFFDAATGSLGQGLSVAAGLALAARRDGTGRRIYVLAGDGESREGQIWEALDFLIDHKLSDVCVVFNCNGQGQAGQVSFQQSPERLAAKLQAFGHEVVTIDGHDPQQIDAAFAKFDHASRPLAIVARTIKGWGVRKLQQGNWHGKPLEAADLPQAQADLDANLKTLLGGAANEKLSGPKPPTPATRPPHHCGGSAQRPDVKSVQWPTFEQAMTAAGFGKALQNGALATRKAYGAALRTAGDLLPHVVVLDGDVSNSTFTELFRDAHPDRFFECKIAEQNMVSTAVGLSAAGYLPFVNSFAKFIARAYDQIELASISRANIKLVGSHAGASLAADGPSQMGLADVAYFRAYTVVRGDDRVSPLCWMFHPADAVAVYHCTRLMVELSGLCYMRTHRPDVPLLYPPDTHFEPGGFHLLTAGEELAIVAAGYMVHAAKQAVELLAKQNVRAALIDAYSLPIDAARLLEGLRRCGGRALTVEDNYGGGLGSAAAEIAARGGGVQVQTLHCNRIPKSTRTSEEELEYCGIGAAQIADHALALLRRPGV